MGPRKVPDFQFFQLFLVVWLQVALYMSELKPESRQYFLYATYSWIILLVQSDNLCFQLECLGHSYLMLLLVCLY